MCSAHSVDVAAVHVQVYKYNCASVETKLGFVYNMSNMLGTQLYITPIQVVWPELCRLQVFGADVHTLPGWSGS